MVRRLRSEVEPVGLWPGASMQLAAGVVSHTVDTRPAECVGPASDVWRMSDPEWVRWVAGLQEQRSFVWIDPPGDATEERLVWLRLALVAAGVPYRIGDRPQRDAVIPEVVVATPAQVCQSIRQVVDELVVEASAGLDAAGVEELRVLNEQVLARVGL